MVLGSPISGYENSQRSSFERGLQRNLSKVTPQSRQCLSNSQTCALTIPVLTSGTRTLEKMDLVLKNELMETTVRKYSSPGQTGLKM